MNMLKKYFQIASKKKLDEIDTVLKHRSRSYKDRQFLAENYADVFNKLRPHYKQIVHNRNKEAKEKGYANFFQYKSRLYGIPKQRTSQFLNSSPVLAKKIIRVALVNLPTKLPSSYWGIYNHFDLAQFINDYPFPKQANSLLKKIVPDSISRRRITLTKHDHNYFLSTYDDKKKTAEIIYDSVSNVRSALLFAHEIGHALHYLRDMDNGVDPESHTDYQHEKVAMDKEFEFENELSEPNKALVRDRILYQFTESYFQYLIYTQPEGNYDKFYADAFNRYWPSRQTSNPLYLANLFMLEYPCYSNIYACIYTKRLMN